MSPSTYSGNLEGLSMITTEEDDSGFPRRGFDETSALLDLLLWSGPTSMIPTREALNRAGNSWPGVLLSA